VDIIALRSLGESLEILSNKGNNVFCQMISSHGTLPAECARKNQQSAKYYTTQGSAKCKILHHTFPELPLQLQIRTPQQTAATEILYNTPEALTLELALQHQICPLLHTTPHCKTLHHTTHYIQMVNVDPIR